MEIMKKAAWQELDKQLIKEGYIQELKDMVQAAFDVGYNAGKWDENNNAKALKEVGKFMGKE